jgi:tetratricopeptide (TPR) repeat protein
MQRILFVGFLLLSLMFFLASPAWAGGLDDANAGLAALNGHNYDEAIRLYTKAIESGELSQKDLSIVLYNRGLAWKDKGDYDKAIADYTKAIELDPKHTSAYYNRGNAWYAKGDYDKAMVDYTKTIEIDPKYTKVYNSLAWLMATCPDDRYRNGKRAVELAEKAVKLDETSNRLDTLAAAYAEAGRFQDAIKTQEWAITKLEQEGRKKSLAEYEEHLASYKSGKPWREK